MDTDARVDPRLHAGGASFGAADAALLRAVADTGSVSGAARRLGRSRARALDRLDELEAGFGALVERRRGGAAGGGSDLTDRGERLLARFDRLRATLAGTARVEEWVLHGTVTAVDGELGTLDTVAGDVLARLVDRPDGTATVGAAVQASVRSEAVTLHDAAAPPGGTSARNRFDGTVVAVDAGDAVARVSVDVGASEPLTALVTRSSLDRLALAPGDPVVAAFKATATRAVPTDG